MTTSFPNTVHSRDSNPDTENMYYKNYSKQTTQRLLYKLSLTLSQITKRGMWNLVKMPPKMRTFITGVEEQFIIIIPLCVVGTIIVVIQDIIWYLAKIRAAPETVELFHCDECECVNVKDILFNRARKVCWFIHMSK